MRFSPTWKTFSEDGSSFSESGSTFSTCLWGFQQMDRKIDNEKNGYSSDMKREEKGVLKAPPVIK